jgi:hypothetical protein
MSYKSNIIVVWRLCIRFNSTHFQQKGPQTMIQHNYIIVWGPSCWKSVRVKSYIIHAQCINWSAGISSSHSRACPLIGSFLLGFTYCGGREMDSDGNIIFRCSFIGNFFLWFHIVITGNVILCLTMIQKRKNIKTLCNLINTRGLRPLVQIR